MDFSCNAAELWTSEVSHPVESTDADLYFCRLIVEVPRLEFRPDDGFPPAHLGLDPAALAIAYGLLPGHVPEVWISDRYSAQQSHGNRHQTCLAHLARDTAFALEHGEDDLPFRFRLWFGRVFDFARAISTFAASTVANKKRKFDRELTGLLCAPTSCDLAQKLQAKIGRARDQLLTFCDYPGEVDVTNNTSERKLRPWVIQRKVTNGYRAMWAAQAEANIRTTVDSRP